MGIPEREGKKQQKTYMKQLWLKISPNFISVQTTDPGSSENQSRGEKNTLRRIILKLHKIKDKRKDHVA